MEEDTPEAKKRPAEDTSSADEEKPVEESTADDAEKKALWPHICSIYPDFEDYQARTDRNIPMFVCSPSAE